MSSEEQPASISEAPMSSDEGEWQPPPEWPKSTMHLVVQGYTPMPKPTRREDPEEVLPAVDPGAFCKPRTPDKPQGTAYDLSNLNMDLVGGDRREYVDTEVPGRTVNPGAFMTYKEQPNVPEAVREIAKQNTFRSEPPKIHPIQQARMAKDAAEPNSFLRNPLFVAPAAALPDGRPYRGFGSPPESSSSSSSAFVHQGMKMAKRQRPGTTVVLWQREWDDEVRRVVKSPNPVRDQQVAETRNAFVKDSLMAEFSRLAMENAKHDADAISHAVAQVDQARELLKKEVRRDYMLRLFLTFVVGVAVVLVLHVVAW